MVKGQWCDEQEGANHWCTLNELADDHEVQHVLCADAKMHPVSETSTSCELAKCHAGNAASELVCVSRSSGMKVIIFLAFARPKNHSRTSEKVIQ